MTAANANQKPMFLQGTPFETGQEMRDAIDKKRQEAVESSSSLRKVRAGARGVQKAGA